jgi:hypothetical protein
MSIDPSGVVKSVLQQGADPSWFYSSISQVTAVVGFLGGFVIVRLVAFMSDWRETEVNILTTDAASEAKRNESARAEGRPKSRSGHRIRTGSALA